MKVSVEDVSPIEKKLSIEVEQARVAEELERAYKALGQQVKIAGFRPGKVPRRILEQRFKEQVEDDVIQRVVERAYLEAIRDHNVQPVANPQVTNQSFKPNEPFSFQALVEVKPKIEPKEYQGLPFTTPDTSVPDSKIDEQLERIRQTMARLEPVEGRDVAQLGDYAVIDYSAQSDGKEFPGSQAENITVEVAAGEIIQSKAPQLEGVKVGDTKEFDYVFPPEYEMESLRGKSAHFKVSLKGLKRQVTPEINDELAKEMEAGETLADLRAKIRSDLETSSKRRAEAEERDQLLQALIDRNPIQVPRAMVDRAADMMLENALRSMARSGIDPRQLNLDFGKLRDEVRPKAEKEVKGSLLLEAIGEKENISPSDEDVEKRIEQIADEMKTAVSTVQKHFRNPDERRGLFLRLREEKTIEFLKAKAARGA